MKRFASAALLAFATIAAATPTCRVRPPSAVPTTPISSSNATSSGSGGNTNCTTGAGAGDDIVAATWFAGWHAVGAGGPAPSFSASNMSFEKYTHVTYAFAITTPDPATISLASSDEQILPQVVTAAHGAGTKVLLSVGGWTGSQYFSTSVGSAANRTAFLGAMMALVKKYNVDGIDIDWEYPNRQGVGCNVISPNDSANLLSFLQGLRADPTGKSLIVTAAVGLTPFAGSDGTPMTDVSAFSDVIDYIAVMNYDVWGSWSATTGPNAPLDDSCAPAADQQGSATGAFKAWTGAKFPAHQILLGVASYGHSWSVSPTAAVDGSGNMVFYAAFDKSAQPAGDSWDAAPGTDQCGNATPQGGVWDFWGMVDGGFLNKDGTVANGIVGGFDNCSQTPFAYNSDSSVFVAYDNAQSFAAKGKFINDQGLGGFAMWQAGGDFDDILLDSIRGQFESDDFGEC